MSIGSSRAGSDLHINQKITYAPSSGVISNNPQVINNIKVIMPNRNKKYKKAKNKIDKA